jgi:hypothetical protein
VVRGAPYAFAPVENEAAAVPGYVNHPAGFAPERRNRIVGPVREIGRRPGMRIAVVALRAYEQRAERRLRMREWLIARAAAAPAGG